VLDKKADSLQVKNKPRCGIRIMHLSWFIGLHGSQHRTGRSGWLGQGINMKKIWQKICGLDANKKQTNNFSIYIAEVNLCNNFFGPMGFEEKKNTLSDLLDYQYLSIAVIFLNPYGPP
jgi:hypothetical protein